MNIFFPGFFFQEIERETNEMELYVKSQQNEMLSYAFGNLIMIKETCYSYCVINFTVRIIKA